MLVLALDTALAACSAALYDSTQRRVLATRHEPMQRGHAERLADMVDEVMREAGLPFRDIDRIAVTTGPGAFTGVRIALAFARALAVALNCPVVGVTTLQALAASAQTQAEGRPVAAVIDARRGEVYFQMFAADLTPLTPAQTLSVAQFTPDFPATHALLIGSGTELVAGHCPQLTSTGLSALPQPDALAAFAATLEDPGTPPVPVYLRAPDAKAQQPLVSFAPVEISLTRVGAEAAGLLAELHAQCFTKPWPAAEMTKLLSMPGTSALIAGTTTSQNQPLGFVMIRQAADEAEIITIATAPHARRRGVAGRLLKAAIADLQNADCRSLHLEVDETNSAALEFYQHSGFTVSGRRKAYYGHADGTCTDAITMQRTL